MKNFRNSGQEVTVTLAATKVSGDLHIVGSLVGVLANSGVNGDKVSMDIEGVFAVKKTAALAVAQGDKVYTNAGTIAITKTNTDAPTGICTKAAAGADATVEVKLIPGMTT